MPAWGNVAIVLALAAAVAFVPGGDTTAGVVARVLSTLIIVSFVLIAARVYRERRMDFDALGERWRLVLYGALGIFVLAMAGRHGLLETGLGTLLWFGLLLGSIYLLFLTWRQHKAYD